MSEHLAAIPLGWSAGAACRGLGTDQVPTATCTGCAVRLDCLDEAFTHRPTTGTWGGYGPDELPELFAGAPDFREVALRDHQRRDIATARAMAHAVHPSQATPAQLALFT